MQTSDEIKSVIYEVYSAMANGRVDDFNKLLSKEPGTLMIGTDPREWWDGYEAISRIFGQQILEMVGKVEIENCQVVAYCRGAVGWAADHPNFVLRDGTKIPFRVTYVLHQEGNDPESYNWKIVQCHVSMGVTNEAVLGEELTV